MNARRNQKQKIPPSRALTGTIEEPGQALQAPANLSTPAMLLQMAVSQGADLDRLERLMELNDRWEANEARNLFNAAVAGFKLNPPTIYKNKRNLQYGSWYSTLDNLVTTANAPLAAHGLSASWDVKQAGNVIEVTCILKHVAGHADRVTMSGAPDTSGAKNALQQIKSTVTYLKGATFESVTGLASVERVGVNRDDDGNGYESDGRGSSGAKEPTEAEKAAGLQTSCKDAKKRHAKAIDSIQDEIGKFDVSDDAQHLRAAAATWRAIPIVDQMALWLPASKGGVLTTHERDVIRNKFPKTFTEAEEETGG